MSTPARRLDSPRGPDNGPDAARARGEALHHELRRQGVDPASLSRELNPDDTAAALAWLRGEGPCPLND